MKTKLTFTLLLILTLSAPLLSQDNWSSARQLSRDGVGPYLFMGVPAITVDGSGTIHAFWVISPSEDGVYNRYSQIEYRRSSDGGKTWTATENLSPEYTTQRIYYMKAACDSDNNVHLVYLRGSEILKVMCKMFDGTSWTEPVQIGAGSSYLRMGIDSDDRVYATWMIGREAFFNYKDGDTWAEYSQIGTGEFGIADIKFDKYNILYANGTCYTDVKPYLFNYEKESETWSKIEEIPNNPDSLTLGRVLAISKNDTVYINNSEGSWIDKNIGVHMNSFVNQGEYSTPYYNGNNNAPDREMYIDTHDYLHLFELHFFEGTVNGPMGLTHSVGKNRVWETVVIDSSYSQYSYSEPNAAFDKINNKFYLLYKIHDRVSSTSRIFFRSKQNTTSIESSDDNVVKAYELYQNYPNPFNNSTKISYSISEPANVKLTVFNLKGELVRRLVNTRQSKGQYSVIFNADDLNSGIYFYRLEVNGSETESRKMLYLK